MSDVAIPITADERANELLGENPLALLVGMLLDQQVPMEWAFKGPATLSERLGGLDATAIAAMDVDDFVAVCCEKPAIHRYPAAMGERIHQVCTAVAEDYHGDASEIWHGVGDARELADRLRGLPGYGEEKTRIFIAILAKRFGVRPKGWKAAAEPFGDSEPRSVADVDSPESLARVREWKKMMKAARRAKSDPVR